MQPERVTADASVPCCAEPLDLAAVAAAQGGPLTRAQALAAGCTARHISTLLRTTWTAPLRGIYVETALLEGDPERRHVVLAAAHVLASGATVVASHRTGALVHHLPLLGKPPTVPQRTRSPRRAGDRADAPGLHVAQLDPTSTTTVDGVPVTVLSRTVCDVARTTPFRAGVVTADAALRAGLSAEELHAEAQRCSRWPGARAARRVAAFGDGRAETPLESITRVAYAEQGLPAPETQVEVYAPDGSFVALVDFLWRAQRTVGEADGMGKYDQPGVGRREKLREPSLARCGLQIVRNTWDDAWTDAGQREPGQRVRETFELACARPAVPGVTTRRPSLADLRRMTETHSHARVVAGGPGSGRSATT